ncbi:MAG TPA: class I SAM-dependent methyltransferase, partial [Acholeplasmataceae bacterium]|nr:class I SAM-dependent methyltransferase [Acholeplasmataceae bacterium]
DLGYDHSYRVLFAEADGIPGLIIDKYGDYLSVQILSLGIDLRKQMFIDILMQLFNPKGIYERSDVPVRKKEGLEPYKGLLYGDVPVLIRIKENDLWMDIDIINGQKTGSFLDQQDNHNAIKPYVKDKTVLDCFSHIGGFGLHAAYHGAKEVTCLDISELAVENIKHNASINNLHQVTAEKADVFEALRSYQKNGMQFDVVVLDPPAFAKKNDDIKKAYQGYKEINLQALKIIAPQGYLISC